MTSTTAAAINARDFGDRVTEANRDEWRAGAMHHLIKALNDAPVTIVLDTHTGFTQANVTLGGVRQTPGYGTFQVLVESVHSGGTKGRCWHPLHKVGAVIIMGDSAPRWEALRTFREERSAAIVRLQKDMAVELGLSNCLELPRGTWSVSVFNGYVHASFSPERVNGLVRYTSKRYESADLARA